MNIFVAKLNYSTTEFDVRELFEQFGTVDTVKIITDRDTGRSKGFGFVEMPDDEAAHAAINALNETNIDDFTIVVKKAVPREERGDRRGGGGGGGGYNRNRSGGGDGYNRDRNSGGGGYNRDRNSGGNSGGGGYRERKKRDSWSDDRGGKKEW